MFNLTPHNRKVCKNSKKDELTVFMSDGIKIRQPNQENIWFAKRILLLSFYAHFNNLKLYNYLPGRLILICGISTSGKSSLVKQLTKTQMSFYFFSRIEFIEEYMLQSLQKCFVKTQYDIISGLFSEEIKHAIFYGLDAGEYLPEKYNFMKEKINGNGKIIINNVYRLLKSDAFFYALMKVIIKLLRNGYNVIVDSRNGDILLDLLAKNHCRYYLFKTLVYCSYNTILSRLYDRNKTALESKRLMDARPLLDPLRGFLEVFKATQNASEAVDVFDIRKIVKREDLHYLSNLILKKRKQTSFPKNYQDTLLQNASNQRKQILLPENYQEMLLKNASEHFDAKPTALITPVQQYQLVLNSTNKSVFALQEEFENKLNLCHRGKPHDVTMFFKRKKEMVSKVVGKHLVSRNRCL